MSEYYYEEEESPRSCPKCDDLEIFRTDTLMDQITIVDDQIIVEWMCGECNFKWYEYYDFKQWKPQSE